MERVLEYSKKSIGEQYDGLISTYNNEIYQSVKDGWTNTDFVINSPEDAKQNFMNNFSRLKELFEELNTKNIEYIVSGSSVLLSIINNKKELIKPHDIDIYLINYSEETIIEFAKTIQNVYGEKASITSLGCVINWWLEGDNVPNIQLIYPSIKHISNIFSTYHSDAVCVGFNGHDIVYAKGRFDEFLKTTKNTFSGVYNKTKTNKKLVKKAFEKYSSRGFDCVPKDFIDMIEKDKTVQDKYIMKKYYPLNYVDGKSVYYGHDVKNSSYYPGQGSSAYYSANDHKIVIKYLSGTKITDVYKGKIEISLFEIFGGYMHCVKCGRLNYDEQKCTEC